MTYLLTTGGHNAGIVSEPGRDGRSYQVLTKQADDRYIDPEYIRQICAEQGGLWRPEWLAGWLGIPVGRLPRRQWALLSLDMHQSAMRRGRLCFRAS